MSRLRQWLTTNRWMLLWVGTSVLVAVMMLGLLWLILGPLTRWAGGPTVRALTGKEKADAVNSIRQTLFQATAGTAAIVVLVFTGRTFFLNRRGQVTDRYSKAITLLASTKLEERIGGIYALEHIMAESERDHETVVQVLAAFIREHAPARTITPSIRRSGRWMHPPAGTSDERSDKRAELPADVQAALTVIARRPTRVEKRFLDLRNTDLRGADLRDANLSMSLLANARLDHAFMLNANISRASAPGVNLEQAMMMGTHMERAHLATANLRAACLIGAHLEDADLSKADLSGGEPGKMGALMHDAHLKGAILAEANLQGAVLTKANLERANLSGANFDSALLLETSLLGADLTDAQGFDDRQLKGALVNKSTKLPGHLQHKKRAT
jgi:uncharacterized protein YjbI with pentapeptide repeats